MAQSRDSAVSDEEIAEELAKYGITCVPADNFYYREYRYTNLRDAIAQSRRDKIRLRLIPEA